MSEIYELIDKLCPNGVPFYSLDELGNFYGGITGKSKDDFVDGNAIFISYKNVYSNPALDIYPSDRVNILADENQRTLEYGDILFTGSSETPDECGISSVVTEQPKENLYLNSFCFIFRFKNVSIMNPNFAKHLFRSTNLRMQIGKTANGVTRYNVSKKLMGKVTIPIPPIEVQNAIASILDGFVELSDELIQVLQEEKDARKKEYEYYRDSLFEFDESVPFMKLGDIATITRGGNFQKNDFIEEGYPCIHYGQMYTHFGISTETTITSISKEVFDKSKKAVKNDIVMAVTSENVEDVCSCVAWLGEDDIAISGHTAIIHHNQNAKYLVYYFHTNHFYKQKRKLAHGTKVIEVTPSKLNDILIPIPSESRQNEIVKLLDSFDRCEHQISADLDMEGLTRIQQYEYYRDKLLEFKRMED